MLKWHTTLGKKGSPDPTKYDQAIELLGGLIILGTQETSSWLSGLKTKSGPT